MKGDIKSVKNLEKKKGLKPRFHLKVLTKEEKMKSKEQKEDIIKVKAENNEI